jgi:BirA family biotin operon repressor/biotin-[acetyl-CoA-carboxylase] ligase
MSFLFSPHINQKNSSLPHDLLVVASLAVFTTLKNLSIPNLSIKWPNDILSQGKKISGILIETSFQNEKPLYTIIGVGMNVLSSPPQLHAAHIAQFREPPPLHSLQKQLQTHMISFFQKLPQQNLSSEYAQHLHLLNQNISLNLQDEVHHGIFRGISNNGALILEIHGEKRLFYTGNVLASSPNTSNSTYLPSISPS